MELHHKKKGADIVILDLPILDTRSKVQGELGKFISDLVVQIMAYIADMERKKNRESQRMGIEAKRERGEWDEYGRPRKISKEKFKKEYKNVQKRKITDKELQKRLEVSDSTYKRYIKELEQKSK